MGELAVCHADQSPPTILTVSSRWELTSLRKFLSALEGSDNPSVTPKL